MTFEKDTIALKALFITPDRGINYTTLQSNARLEWKIYRVLLIGHTKNVDNDKCYFSKLPKDVIHYMVKFLLIDDSSFTIINFKKTATFHDITERYTNDLKPSIKAFFQRSEVNTTSSDMPFVHIWVQFGCVKNIYLIDKHINVTKDDLKTVDLKKWVEIPDDYTNLKLCDVNINEYNRICVEFIGIRDIFDIPRGNGERITRWERIHSGMFWPLAKPDDKWKDLQVGDIVEILVK